MYNGWSNHATWNASLWLNNDEQLYRNLQVLVMIAENVDQLTGLIEKLCKDNWPSGKTPDGDLLSDVDFSEIANAEIEG